ncbi:MAG: GNAT family N-acetyltransferase [Crocosphaera sp.]|nr:GNAT family N-acetyltransferase [Crocosphaera sp.]
MSKLIIKQVQYQDELEAIKMIRCCVFQEEQGVDPALEFDGYDESCEHLLAYWNDQTVGTTRIRYLDEETAKIERLAVLLQARGQGIGSKLVKQAIQIIEAKKTYTKIMIHAQIYIQSLYKKFGFKPVGDRFLEGDIIHIKMIKLLNQLDN